MNVSGCVFNAFSWLFMVFHTLGTLHLYLSCIRERTQLEWNSSPCGFLLSLAELTLCSSSRVCVCVWGGCVAVHAVQPPHLLSPHTANSELTSVWTSTVPLPSTVQSEEQMKGKGRKENERTERGSSFNVYWHVSLLEKGGGRQDAVKVCDLVLERKRSWTWPVSRCLRLNRFV